MGVGWVPKNGSGGSVCEKVVRDLCLSSSPVSFGVSSPGGAMRRSTIDRLASTEGLVLVPVLAVAGGLLTWAQRYITSEVRDQLEAQKIYFPASDSPELAVPEFEAVRQYAGQQLTTGDQAKVYADHYIANHLKA